MTPCSLIEERTLEIVPSFSVHVTVALEEFVPTDTAVSSAVSRPIAGVRDSIVE